MNKDNAIGRIVQVRLDNGRYFNAAVLNNNIEIIRHDNKPIDISTRTEVINKVLTSIEIN